MSITFHIYNQSICVFYKNKIFHKKNNINIIIIITDDQD